MSFIVLLQIFGLLVMFASFVMIGVWLWSPRVKKRMEKSNSHIPFKDNDIKGD